MNKRFLALLSAVLCVALAFIISFTSAKSKEYKKLKAQQEEKNVPVISEGKTTREEKTEAPTEGENVTEGTEETEAPEETSYNISDDDTLPDPTIINMPTDENWSIVLINKFYKMNEEYEPFLSLINEADGIYLDERVTNAYLKMAEAAAEDGITLTVAAGYVSPDRQNRMFEKEVSTLITSGLTEEEAKAKAAFTVLPVGCNEANYGLSVDIGWLGADFADSPAYVWLRAHAAQYGFIERYTADGEKITHFNAIPWHWRYVGADAAKYIREHGITLEEYVGKVN